MHNNENIAKDCLMVAGDLIFNRRKENYWYILNSYTDTFKARHSIKITPENFDDFLYNLTEKVWPAVVTEVCATTNKTSLDNYSGPFFDARTLFCEK